MSINNRNVIFIDLLSLLNNKVLFYMKILGPFDENTAESASKSPIFFSDEMSHLYRVAPQESLS